MEGPSGLNEGWITDLEKMNLPEKLNWLRENKRVKCGVKWEVNDLHEKHRGSLVHPNWWGIAKGLEASKELSREPLPNFEKDVLKVTVDVGLNYEDDHSGHWTNV